MHIARVCEGYIFIHLWVYCILFHAFSMYTPILLLVKKLIEANAEPIHFMEVKSASLFSTF